MRILVADDHDLLRDTLSLYFQGEFGVAPATAPDLPTAREIVEEGGRFDLVILDFGMPGMNGLDGLREALGWSGVARVALMSGHAPQPIAEAALALGAAGYLPKTMSARTMANAIRFMAMGETYAPPEVYGQRPTRITHPIARSLTPREMQVLEGLCAGKPNKEIARDLSVMEPTVKLHVKTLYRKLDAANRTQAALIAKQAGLF